MISNEAVQRLIACDRETLIALMAVAHAAGRYGGGVWDVCLDPDIKALVDAARAENARPVAMTTPDGWTTRGQAATPRNRKAKDRQS